jgi:OOP family OmpA-OmpF porin
MKLNLLKIPLILAGLLMSTGLLAQSADTSVIVKPDYVKPFSEGDAFRTWSIGINAGSLSTYTILTSNAHLGFTSPNLTYGYGGYVKKQILHGFGLRADVLFGTLTGDHGQFTSGIPQYENFKTKLNYAASLSSEFTLANVNWRYNKSAMQLYITTGVGTINYKPTLTTTTGIVENFKAGTDVLNELYAPVGVGLKFNVANGINIDVGYQVNFVYSDNLDGYRYGTSDQKFSYTHIGFEFAIGKRSKPQLATHNPVSSMREEYLSEIKLTKDSLQAQVDSSTARTENAKKQLAAASELIAKLTADSDGDGVSDYFDKCPNTPAGVKVDGSGCPLPTPKPEEKVYVVTEEDKAVASEAVKDLEFDTGSSTISEHSYPSLGRLAKLLADKNFSLKLAGYTDSRGSVAINLKLSQQRAEAVKMYLVSKGADPAKIEADGYGKANPIASNKTADGRKLNRRVEFTLY